MSFYPPKPGSGAISNPSDAYQIPIEPGPWRVIPASASGSVPPSQVAINRGASSDEARRRIETELQRERLEAQRLREWVKRASEELEEARRRETQASVTLQSMGENLAKAKQELARYQEAWKQVTERDRLVQQVLAESQAKAAFAEELRCELQRSRADLESERAARSDIANQCRTLELELQSLRSQREMIDRFVNELRAAHDADLERERQINLKRLADVALEGRAALREARAESESLKSRLDQSQAQIGQLQAKIRAHALQQAKAQVEAEARAQAQARSEAEARELAQAREQLQALVEAQAKAQAQAQVQAQVQAQAQAQVEIAQAVTQVTAQTQAQTQIETTAASVSAELEELARAREARIAALQAQLRLAREILIEEKKRLHAIVEHAASEQTTKEDLLDALAEASRTQTLT